MRVTILLLAGLAAIAADPIPSSGPERIVGGSVTTISQYPFGTPLQFSFNLVTFFQSCGGTIINNRSILSAAHCFFGTTFNQWRIRVGSTYASSGGTVHNAALFINYPGYVPSITDNDIAILRSATTIGFIPNAVQPASIAGTNYFLADNSVVWAIGWGLTVPNQPNALSEQLRHVQIWTVNQEICRSRYAELGRPITDSMLCSGWLDVGGRDQCQNDSGGPLLHNNVVVGVCSWGAGCAQARFPGVNARVSRFTLWIQANA